MHPSGAIYGCGDCAIISITSTGIITTIVTLSRTPKAIFVDPQGTTFVAVEKGIYKINHRHEITAICNLISISDCEGLTADHEGNLYFSACYSIYKITGAAAATTTKLINDLMKINELNSGNKFTANLFKRSWEVNHEILSIRCPAFQQLIS